MEMWFRVVMLAEVGGGGVLGERTWRLWVWIVGFAVRWWWCGVRYESMCYCAGDEEDVSTLEESNTESLRIKILLLQYSHFIHTPHITAPHDLQDYLIMLSIPHHTLLAQYHTSSYLTLTLPHPPSKLHPPTPSTIDATHGYGQTLGG